MMRRGGTLLLVLLLAAVNRVAAEPLAYVALANARKVAVVDVGAGRVVRTFTVPVSPHGIAASPDGRLLFVPDLLLEKVIRVLDAETGRELRQIDAGAPVHHLTLSPDGRRLYATLTSVGRLAVVELTSWTVRTVEVGGAPYFAVPTSGDRLVYVTDVEGTDAVVVDPGTASVRGRITLGEGPSHGAVTADGTRGFFTAAKAGMLAVVDLQRGRRVATVSTGPDPHGVALGEGSRRLFVSNRGGRTVLVVDTATLTVERAIVVGEAPDHVTASPDGRLILVAVPSERTIAVIDAERLEVVDRIAVDGEPHQIAF